jgi:hypothetical protein
MSDNLAVFSSVPFREIVQDLRELLSHRRVAFLLGAGCSRKAGLPLMSELTEQVLDHAALSDKTSRSLNSVRELFSGAGDATIEDFMSELVDYLSVANRRKRRGAAQCRVSLGNDEYTAEELADALDEIKRAVVQVLSPSSVDISHHRRFIGAVHSSLEAGKPRRTVDYFVLNYDTLLEDALGLERVHYVDGFAGAATGWWQPSLFENEGAAARVFKLHGSIDWCLFQEDRLPRRVRRGLDPGAQRQRVLIYPAATKYQEAQRDPFAQLLQQMRQCLRPPANDELVLAICGYSFGDSHIDLEVHNALRESEGRLTLAAFVSEDEAQRTVRSWVDEPNIGRQVRVYANKAFIHSDTTTKSEVALPWWKFEVLAALLGGER